MVGGDSDGSDGSAGIEGSDGSDGSNGSDAIEGSDGSGCLFLSRPIPYLNFVIVLSVSFLRLRWQTHNEKKGTEIETLSEEIHLEHVFLSILSVHQRLTVTPKWTVLSNRIGIAAITLFPIFFL